MKLQMMLLTIFVSFYINVATAQEIIECAASIPPGVTVEQAQSADLSLYKRTTFTDPLRLAVHIVRYSNGFGGITELELDQKKNELNYFMADVYLQFFIYKVDYIDSDYFANIDTEEKENELRLVNVVEDCINVYFVPNARLNGISSFSPRI